MKRAALPALLLLMAVVSLVTLFMHAIAGAIVGARDGVAYWWAITRDAFKDCFLK